MIRTTTTTALAVLAFTFAACHPLSAAPPDRQLAPEDLPVLVLDLSDPMPAATPAPGPTVLQPVIIQPAQNFQAAATSWVNAIAAVLMVIVTVLLPAFAVLWSKVREVTKRQDRQAEKQGQIDHTVRQALAAAPSTIISDPAAPPTPVIPGGSSGKHLMETIERTVREVITKERRPGGLLAAIAALLILSGCSTTGLDPARNARNAGLNAAGSKALAIAGKVLTKAVVQGLVSATKQEVAGGKVDFAQAAAAGLWANVDAAETYGDVQSIANAFSAGKARALANQAAHAYDVALANGVEPSTAISAIASVISTTTGAPPAK